MKKRQLLYILTVSVLMIGAVCQGEAFYTNTCLVSDDLYIKQNGTKTQGTSSILAGSPGAAGNDHRIFMQFDMPDFYPNASIFSATLKLYHIAGANDTWGDANLREITATWTTNTVTYGHSVSTGSTLIVNNAGPFNEYKSIDVTAMIKGWLQDTNSHHGYSIRGSEGFSSTAKYFQSSEGANVPVLTIVSRRNVAILDVDEDLDIQSDETKTDNTQLVAGKPGNDPTLHRRAFMKFDMTPLTDQGDNLGTITQATLRLYHIEGAFDTWGDCKLHEITATWTTNTATYGLGVSAALTSIVGYSGPFNEYKDIDVTTELQGWRQDSSNHHGFSVRGNEGTSQQTGKYFQSSTGANPPELIVRYKLRQASMFGIY